MNAKYMYLRARNFVFPEQKISTIDQVRKTRIARFNQRQRFLHYRVRREFQLKPEDYINGIAPVMIVGFNAGAYWSVDAFAIRDRNDIGPYPTKKGNGKIRVSQKPLQEVVQTAIEWVDDSNNGCDLMSEPLVPDKLTGRVFKRLIHVRQLPLPKGA
jgi:hypothetical protein